MDSHGIASLGNIALHASEYQKVEFPRSSNVLTIITKRSRYEYQALWLTVADGGSGSAREVAERLVRIDDRKDQDPTKTSSS